ncbi:MAG: NAD-dependent epimerase/dehydratase family protein [Chitinophagaceae bacterium]
MNEIILITGGCGFVGSGIGIKIKRDFPDARVIAMDNLMRRGSELNVKRLQAHNIEFIHGDIRNVEDFFQIGEISILIETAAEPSVLAGIHSGPDYVLNTNLLGTINCLNFAAKHKSKFIFLSTSRVYPISKLNNINYTELPTRFNISDYQEQTGVSGKGINESFSLSGARSFYGASKLASELLVQEYSEFYQLKTVINRCGVITGPWQMGKVDQGVVVLWLSKHFWKKDLNYIGYGGLGKQVRDLLHIDDLYALIKLQITDLDKYENGIYNVGGSEYSNSSLNELTTICEKITGNKITINSIQENRPADIRIYITDNSKIESVSGWKPKKNPEQILNDIFQWLELNEEKLKDILK